MTRARSTAVRLLIAVVLGVSGVSPSGSAHASDAAATPAQRCATDAERGQALRRQTKLLEARDTFRACARAECPAIVAQDCARWEDEVQAAIPTIVPGARDEANRDLTDVRLSIDGRAIPDPLDGRAVELDPGRRELVFERTAHPALHETIVVREGEKNRLVVVRWSAPVIATTPPASSTRVEAPPPAVTPAWVWALGAGGVVVGGVGAGFALAADARYHDLQSSCGTTRSCDADEVSRTRTTLWAADAAIVVGAAAAITAAWLAFGPSAVPPR